MENNKVNEYFQELEKEYGISKTDPNKPIDKKHLRFVVGIYDKNSSFSRSKYEWTIKMRLNHAWQMFKSYYGSLNKYNLFDFKSYEEKWNPYGFDIYADIYKTSTPWTRLGKFLEEVKNMFYYTFKAYGFTPTTVKHYQKNKKRITWFEENVWGWFFGSKKEKETHKQILQDLGYTVSKDGNSVEYKLINE